MFAATSTDQVVFAVVSHAGGIAFHEHVFTWCRLLRTAAHRQKHANQLTSLAQQVLDLINLDRVGILYATGIRHVRGEVANGALFRRALLGRTTRRLLAFWRRCMHRGSLAHV